MHALIRTVAALLVFSAYVTAPQDSATTFSVLDTVFFVLSNLGVCGTLLDWLSSPWCTAFREPLGLAKKSRLDLRAHNSQSIARRSPLRRKLRVVPLLETYVLVPKMSTTKPFCHSEVWARTCCHPHALETIGYSGGRVIVANSDATTWKQIQSGPRNPPTL